MEPVLDYHSYKPIPWSALIWSFSKGSLLGMPHVLLCGLVLWIVFYVLPTPLPVERRSADSFWYFIYRDWVTGCILEDDGEMLACVIQDNGPTLYFRAPKREVEATADQGARESLKILVPTLDACVRNGSEVTNPTVITLRALTRQDFGHDPKAWRDWISAHVQDVKGGMALYRAFFDARSEAARASGGWNLRDPSTVLILEQARYDRLYRHYWRDHWLQLLTILLSVLGMIAWHIWSRRYRIPPPSGDESNSQRHGV